MSRAEQLVREYELACQAYEMVTGTQRIVMALTAQLLTTTSVQMVSD